MNIHNDLLGLYLILLVLYNFGSNFFKIFLGWLIGYDFFVQVLAVAIGVVGGMWADKLLQKQESIRRIVGGLEIIDAELQSNSKAVAEIKEVINTRPSCIDRSKYPSDKVIELVQNEEKWVADISKRIVEKGYYSVLPIISTIDNRNLFEKIINTYLKLRNIQLVLELPIMNSFAEVEGYSENQKKEVIVMGDQHFNNLSESLTALEETFKDTDKDLIEEEKKLLSRFKRF